MCGKICKAKKKAKKAKKEADEAQKKAGSSGGSGGSDGDGGVTMVPSGVEVVTVADALSVPYKHMALKKLEVFTLLKDGKNNKDIKNSSAALLFRTMTQVSLVVFTAFIIAGILFKLIKPASKFAALIGDIFPINPLGISEMVADIGILLVTIFTAISSFAYKQIKKAFFTIPLYTKLKLKEKQERQIIDILNDSKNTISKNFKSAVRNLSSYDALNDSDKDLLDREVDQSELSNKQTEIDNKQTEIDNKEDEIDNKEDEIDNKETEIDNKEDEIDNKEDEIDNKEDEIDNKQTEIEEKEIEISEKEAEIEEETDPDTISQLESELSDLETELNTLNTEIDQLISELETLVNEKNDLGDDLNALNDEKDTLDNDLNSLNNEKDTLDDDLNTLNDELLEINSLENMANEILNKIENEEPYEEELADLEMIMSDVFERSLENCKEIILKEVETDTQKKITDIEDVMYFDKEEKEILSKTLDSYLDFNSQLEMTENVSLLNQKFTACFDCERRRKGEDLTEEEMFGNELAEAMSEKVSKLVIKGKGFKEAFLKVLKSEIDKKKKETIRTKDDIIAIDYLRNNLDKKSYLIKEDIINKVRRIKLDHKEILAIDYEYINEVKSELINTRNINVDELITYTENQTIQTDVDFDNLVDYIKNELNDLYDFDVESIDHDIYLNFKDSVCLSIERFKKHFYNKIENPFINNNGITLKDYDLNPPEYIENRTELIRIFRMYINEIKLRLLSNVKEIVEENIVPCKSCRPCDNMVNDIDDYISKKIKSITDYFKKDFNRKIFNVYEMNIEDRKEEVINILNAKKDGDISFDVYSFLKNKINKEESELLKTIMDYIKRV
jgi:predicted  nucleic acid-binding Zn-ribbon protein